jgi:NAD-dependent dihydropyrimidine dehydrogenase PreA subunit
MSKTWYPVIDRSTCQECGVCVEFCPHGVYDRAKAPFPMVVNTDGCVDHCHGCGNQCPTGAISYVGDDTGWIAPGSETGIVDSLRSHENERAEKGVTVEYLYLDLNTCNRCIGTDAVLDDVISTLTPALKLAGYMVEYKKIEMKSADIATKYKFLSSPTIRVNGRDICSSVDESSCNCCSDISGTDVDCRVFVYEGKEYEVPPETMLAETILLNVFAQHDYCPASAEYSMPDNLKSFFEGKARLSCCS